MPDRQYSAATGYRYGFNGKENDNEVKEEGNSIDYGLRIYDSRLGRFLSTDPLGKKFPFLTPYQFASNSPIAFIDLDGAEANYASFKMIAESIEAEAALYKGNTKDMPFRLKSQLFMLGMAKSASVEGLMYEIDKGLQATFSNLPSINFNELPPSVQQDLMQQSIDRNSPFGIVAVVKGLGNTAVAAAEGNPEALGNIAGMILAARMFKMPESELSSTASGEFLQNVRNITGSTDEAMRQIGNGITDFKELEGVTLSSSPRYFRGTKSVENPFTMSAADINNAVNKKTGLMKENGVSLNLDKNNKFVQLYGGAWEVDISTIPVELKLKHTSGTHYEITPQKAGTMTLERYQELLKQVKVKPYNTTE